METGWTSASCCRSTALQCIRDRLGTRPRQSLAWAAGRRWWRGPAPMGTGVGLSGSGCCGAVHRMAVHRQRSGCKGCGPGAIRWLGGCCRPPLQGRGRPQLRAGEQCRSRTCSPLCLRGWARLTVWRASCGPLGTSVPSVRRAAELDYLRMVQWQVENRNLVTRARTLGINNWANATVQLPHTSSKNTEAMAGAAGESGDATKGSITLYAAETPNGIKVGQYALLWSALRAEYCTPRPSREFNRFSYRYADSGGT